MKSNRARRGLSVGVALGVAAFILSGCAAEPEPFVADPEVQQLVADAMETQQAKAADKTAEILATASPTPTPTPTAELLSVEASVTAGKGTYVGYTYNVSAYWSELRAEDMTITPAAELGTSYVAYSFELLIGANSTTPNRELPSSYQPRVGLWANYAQGSLPCALGQVENRPDGSCLLSLGYVNLIVTEGVDPAMQYVVSPGTTSGQLQGRFTTDDASVDQFAQELASPLDYFVSVAQVPGPDGDCTVGSRTYDTTYLVATSSGNPPC